MNSKDLIKNLNLLPHPEGGYYKETYRSEVLTTIIDGKTRNTCTAIYYLLEGDDKSNFHRLQSDEMWFFHQGNTIEILTIQNNCIETYLLGNDIANGEISQLLIPANIWFAAKIKIKSGYSLVSCTVSPGFDFEDFELARRNELSLEFPHLIEIIEQFTNNQ
jgi:predicted cupin superfamily sugar epimerase